MKENLKKDKKNLRPHYTKIIEYNREPWLTDIIIGQKGSSSHAHMTVSGAVILYLRDEQGNEIINKDF